MPQGLELPWFLSLRSLSALLKTDQVSQRERLQRKVREQPNCSTFNPPVLVLLSAFSNDHVLTGLTKIKPLYHGLNYQRMIRNLLHKEDNLDYLPCSYVSTLFHEHNDRIIVTQILNIRNAFL